MQLSSIINPRFVFLDHQFNTYQDIISFVAEKFSNAVNINAVEIKDAFNRRENLGTTFLGHFLALPHGYLDKIDDIYVIFIRLSHQMSVSYNNRENKIKYIFAVLTSTKKAQIYLKVLSAIAHLVTTDSHLLDNAKNGKELIESIEKKQVKVDEGLVASNLIFTNVSIDNTQTIAEAVDVMKCKNITFLPVVNSSEELLGIIDLADIFAATFKGENISADSLSLIHDLHSARELIFEPIQHFWENEYKHLVGEIMRTADTYKVSTNGSYSEIVFAMTKYHHRYLVVVDKNDKVAGLIDTDDIVHKMIRV